MKERTVCGLQCSEVLELLSDYLDQELEAAKVERVEGHLLGCPNCERFGKNFGSMVVSLRKDAAMSEMLDPGFLARLLSRIDPLATEH